MISPSQRHLPDNTQHSQVTDIIDHGRIRTRNSSKRAAADPPLRPRGHSEPTPSLPNQNTTACQN